MKLFCLLILLFVWPAHAVNARDFEMPNSVAAIVEAIGQDVPVGQDFRCSSLHGNPMLYTVEDEGTIVQIGARIFSSHVRESVDSLVCDCIERVWLQMMLCGNVDEMKRILDISNISISLDGHPLGSRIFRSLEEAESVIHDSRSFDYSVKKNDIVLTFKETGGSCLRMTLPADRSVLSSMDKKEQEDYFARKLMKAKVVFHPGHLDDHPSVVEENGYYVTSPQCYMIDSVNTKIYYRKHGYKLTPVFSKSDPVISLRNIAMGAVPCEQFRNVSLDIRFKTYAGISGESIILLQHFLGFMERQGLDFYCADFTKNGETKVIYLFHHPVHQYVSMLTVAVPSVLTFSTPCVLKAELDAFIPQNNIKALFDNHNSTR